MRELLQAGDLENSRARLKAGEGSPADLAAYEILIEVRDRLRQRDYFGLGKFLERAGSELEGYIDLAQFRAGLEVLDHGDSEALEAWKGVPYLAAEACCAQGVQWARAGQTEQARAAFEQALRLDPGHYRSLTNLGNLALEAGEAQVAIDWYQKALALNPDYPGTHHNLAAAYRKLRQLDKSVYHLKKSQQLTLRPPSRGGSLGGGSASRSPVSYTPWWRRWWIWLVLAVVAHYLLGRGSTGSS